MYRRIADFEHDWDQERSATVRVLRALTDASLEQRVTPDGRTLGRIAWHLVATLGKMAQQAQLDMDAPVDEDALPPRAEEIAGAYDRAASAVGPAVRALWSDEDLGEKIPMYGQEWNRGAVLASLIRHQAHHRGQMTVLMRQAGLVVPGVYGPAREEWAAMGMPPRA